jgi:hypothetical protein
MSAFVLSALPGREKGTFGKCLESTGTLLPRKKDGQNVEDMESLHKLVLETFVDLVAWRNAAKFRSCSPMSCDATAFTVCIS